MKLYSGGNDARAWGRIRQWAGGTPPDPPLEAIHEGVKQLIIEGPGPFSAVAEVRPIVLEDAPYALKEAIAELRLLPVAAAYPLRVTTRFRPTSQAKPGALFSLEPAQGDGRSVT